MIRETAPSSPAPSAPDEAGASGAAAIFERVFQAMRPRSAVPRIRIRFSRFANANCFIQLKQGEADVRISDVLLPAPAEVIEALAFMLISKLYRLPPPKEHERVYRRHLSRQAVRSAISRLRRERGRKRLSPPRGSYFDLGDVFEEINFQYFHGLMARPELGWSLRASRQTLGHYDPAHHAIVINRILDSASTPPTALRFVMYHEMLHVKYPVEQRGERRCVHTRDFRRAEREFDGYEEAKRMLRNL